MLIEEIVEFELRSPGPLVVQCTYIPKAGYFHDKTKVSKANLWLNYLMLKMLRKTMYLAFPDLGQVTKFNPTMQKFKCALKLTWSK